MIDGSVVYLPASLVIFSVQAGHFGSRLALSVTVEYVASSSNL